jgi:hypothetical protein
MSLIYLYDWAYNLYCGKHEPVLPWWKGINGPNLYDLLLSAQIEDNKDIFTEHMGDISLTEYGKELNVNLTPFEVNAISHIIEETGDRNTAELNLLVLSTYPMRCSDVGDGLDLFNYGIKYKREHRDLNPCLTLNTEEVYYVNNQYVVNTAKEIYTGKNQYFGDKLDIQVSKEELYDIIKRAYEQGFNDGKLSGDNLNEYFR